jgi:NAD(P)H-dependent FMN reductase
MLKLKLIIGSTRDGRHSETVLKWLKPILEADGRFELDVLDLREWPLPSFQEVVSKMGDLRSPTYSDPLVQKWNAKIAEADAYVIVSPEYNHSVPAVLKNAIDSVFFSYAFRHKAVAFVGYSIGVTAGARAIDHLIQIMVETEAIPVRTPTLIPFVATAFNAQGKPSAPQVETGLQVELDDLAWLAQTLKKGRQESHPPPSAVRIRNAAAAAAAAAAVR